MSLTVRDVRLSELPLLHRLNQAEVPHVGGVELPAFLRFFIDCPYFRVAENGKGIAGFLIAMGPRQEYGSLNYLWFKKRLKNFLYVDRIVVAPDARRLGVGRALYKNLAAFGRGRTPCITCEVNLEPPNPVSMDFHARIGFSQMGVLEHGPGKSVAMLHKTLI